MLKNMFLLVCLCLVWFTLSCHAEENEEEIPPEVVDVNACPENCNIKISFDKDRNSLSGDVNISIPPVLRTYEAFAMVDENPERHLFCIDLIRPARVRIRTHYFSNGPHVIKVVCKKAINQDEDTCCSQFIDVVFNNEISEVKMSSGYDIHNGFSFSARGNPSTKYILKILKTLDKKQVYSEDFSGNINAVIQPDVFVDKEFMYDIIVEDSAGNEKFQDYFGRTFESYMESIGVQSTPNPNEPNNNATETTDYN